MNLYMISLGGKASGANIEVHDVQFAAADHIDDTIELVKANWYGVEEKLHIDCYKKINGADGYEVKLEKEKSNGQKRLFFVHLGGYDKNKGQEVHQVALFASETANEAKHRAFIETETSETEWHVDQVVDVEASLLQRENEKYFLELRESEAAFDLRPDWFGYKRLDIGGTS